MHKKRWFMVMAAVLLLASAGMAILQPITVTAADPPGDFHRIGDWRAHSDANSSSEKKDVVNFGIFGPGLSVGFLKQQLEGDGWVDDSPPTFTPGVPGASTIYVDTNDGHGYQGQDFTVTNDGDWYTHCRLVGQTCIPRDHVRFWHNEQAGIHSYYGAASMEQLCGVLWIPCGGHKLVSNGFNDGRDKFATYVQQIAERFHWQYAKYDLYIASNNGVTINDAVADGHTTVFCIDPNNTYYCVPRPATPIPTATPPAPNCLSAAWQGDNYQGNSLTSLTLDPGARSDKITLYVKNTGCRAWDSNTFIAVYDPNNPNNPPGASSFCDPTGSDGLQDWYSCNPGLAAWVGDGRSAGPGATVPFVFQIQAPDNSGNYTRTLYFGLAERVGNNFYWLRQPNGQATYEFFDVHVNRYTGCRNCQ